jgi:hypothetical protein
MHRTPLMLSVARCSVVPIRRRRNPEAFSRVIGAAFIIGKGYLMP